MPGKAHPRSLKVCSTCRHWTPKYKGFCRHLQQGVGKFHICGGWRAENPAPDADQPPEAVALDPRGPE